MSTTFAVATSLFHTPTAEHHRATIALSRPVRSRPVGFTPSGEAEPVDMARLLEMVDDDAAGLRELVTLYLTESHELMGSLQAAVHSGSATQVEWAAHKLGGSSATCGMIGIVAPLREMEKSGREGGRPEDELLLRETARQHDRICAYLTANIIKN